MRIFVLGAGATGGLLAQLLERQGHLVWCGDREPERARRFLGPKIECLPANARNLRAVVRAGRNCHLLINAAPATFNETVIRAALRLRAHYLDMASHLNRYAFKAEQLRYDRRFREKRRLALINAGVAPGLTNLVVARSADQLDQVEQVRIRLFEETESEDPISTWSADTAFDEAVSRPRIYRQGHFRLARRFSEPEKFRFPPPIGQTRVVLAAQDEVGTLPHFISMKELDVKIGGNEIDRLRRWYRQGKLRPSAKRVIKRFPRTPSPRQVAQLIRRGILHNARFAVAVVVTGSKNGEPLELRCSCVFPSLYQLRQQGFLATPIAYVTAHTAAAFVKYLPRQLWGVYPPEALPASTRKIILAELRHRGFQFFLQTIKLKPAEEEETEEL